MMTPNPYPFQQVQSPPAKPVTRRVMGVEECTICGLAVEYCRGHEAAQDSAAQDGAESSLARRVAQVRKGMR